MMQNQWSKNMQELETLNSSIKDIETNISLKKQSQDKKTHFLARPSWLPPSLTVMCIIPQGSTLLA